MIFKIGRMHCLLCDCPLDYPSMYCGPCEDMVEAQDHEHDYDLGDDYEQEEDT